MYKKSFVKLISFLALILFSSSFKVSMAQTGVIGIDILLNPNQTMLDSAKAYNALMRKNYSGPGSFSLDAVHTPHISVLQCFIKTSDLKKVIDAVDKVVKREKPEKETLTTKGFYFLPDKTMGLAGITINTTPALLTYQSKIIEAVKPYIVTGNDSAFVQNPNGRPLVKGLTEYVNAFIPDHSGAKYLPHVTIGLAQANYLKDLMAKPYNSFNFKVSSASIYHLGDYGTAQNRLWTSAK
jgi:2'-5' RNA ligase superfamily